MTSHDTTPEIEDVDLDTRLVTYADGTVGRITNMFDEFGDDTNNSDEACSAVADHESGDWVVIELDREGGPLTLH